MKKVIYCSSLFVLAVCLNACREIVPLKDLGYQPKLVLYCFATPQYDTIPVFLSNSQPFFSGAKVIAEVTNAIVEISNDNQHWIQLHYDRKSKRYLWLQSQLPVAEGKTYYIRASAPDYESISASCTVPFWRKVELTPEIKIPYPHKTDNPTAVFSILWNDYPSEENYYAAVKYYFSEWSYGDEYEKHFEYYWLWNEKERECVLSDAGKDGKRMSIISESIYDYVYPFDSAEFLNHYPQYDATYILFIQTEKNTCLHENTKDAAEMMEDIFSMIEPTLVYTNVKNGYGVFGAMVFKSYRISFRHKTVEEGELPISNQVETFFKSKTENRKKNNCR